MKRPNDKSAPTSALYNWYPGHMAKGLREIKEKLNLVDIVLEVRDARVPLASGNRAMDEIIGKKRKLIIFNKYNLADPKIVELWTHWLDFQEISYLFVDCFDKNAVTKILSKAKELIQINRRLSNPDIPEKAKFKMMIVGLPNTGKSTIINQLANKSVVKTADKPGHTQKQQWITVTKDIDLMDTPGIMPPMIDRPEHALWLSAIHALPDDISGEDRTSDFIVKHLLDNNSQEFLNRFKLENNLISIDEAYSKIAILRGCVRQKGLPDLARVHKLILAEFRKGDFGRVSFGLPPKV